MAQQVMGTHWSPSVSTHSGLKAEPSECPPASERQIRATWLDRMPRSHGKGRNSDLRYNLGEASNIMLSESRWPQGQHRRVPL